MRPERRDALAALLRSGKLEAGPWYVLADELIPSGEALVRNLLAGRRVLASLGATSQPVLYCPDAFGHPATLPELAYGFGLSLIIAWRGFGSRRWPRGDTFRWRAPSGVSALLYHLPKDGYEFGSSLPSNDAGARSRWARIRAELGSRSTAGVTLLQNGADHHARQRQYRQAVEALARTANGEARVRGSSMRQFTAELLDATERAIVPAVGGELRDSYGYTWTLQGTFAARAHQKRMNAIAERTLLRDAEPFAALAWAAGGVSREPLTDMAWRTLLQAHPHDTLCGCSIDAVARAMEVRVADAVDQAKGISEDAVLDILGHDRDEARERRAEWRPAIVVRNRAPRPRGGIVVVVVDDFLADVPVGPGSAGEIQSASLPSAQRIPGITGVRAGQPLGEIAAVYDRIEAARYYPDNDLIARQRVAFWVDPVPAYGVVMLPRDRQADIDQERVAFVELREQGSSELLERSAKPTAPARGSVAPPPNLHPAIALDSRANGIQLDNGIIRLVAQGDSVSVDELASGRRIDDLLRIDDREDQGDLYTPSVRRDGMSAKLDDVRVIHGGPLIATVRQRWRLRHETEDAGATLDIDLSLHADSPVIRVDVRGTNHRPNHRLRLGLRTDVERSDVWADAAFGPVLRVTPIVPSEDSEMEACPPTAPLHRYVSLFGPDRGATVFSDGLAEYESSADGMVFVTLLRAVGELSRNDLPERPGHAGWPSATPLAQSHGPFEASFALQLHGPRSDETITLVERTADDVLLPLTGDTLRSAVDVAPPIVGAELAGEGMAFSTLKEGDNGAAVVARCVNLLERDVDASWRFGFPIRSVYRSRLDETRLEAMAHDGGRVTFRAGPREVVTLLVVPDR